MPREAIPLIRKGGFLEARKLYILAYEGNVTERVYFEGLRRSDLFDDSGLIEMISLPNSRKEGNDPWNLTALLEQIQEEYNFDETDEFWSVVDRDHWEKSNPERFSELIQDYKRAKNFFIAMSNPCFELWLILHFKSVDDFTEQERSALLENRKISKSKSYCAHILGDLQQTGRGFNKRPDMAIFLPRVREAILRAESLCQPNEDYPHRLGTHVHKLIRKLIKP